MIFESSFENCELLHEISWNFNDCVNFIFYLQVVESAISKVGNSI